MQIYFFVLYYSPVAHQPHNCPVSNHTTPELNHTTPQCWTTQPLSVEPSKPSVLNQMTPWCWTTQPLSVEPYIQPQCQTIQPLSAHIHFKGQNLHFLLKPVSHVSTLWHSNGYFIFNACSFFLVYSQDILLSLLLVIFLSACLYYLCACTCTCVLNSLCFL